MNTHAGRVCRRDRGWAVPPQRLMRLAVDLAAGLAIAQISGFARPVGGQPALPLTERSDYVGAGRSERQA